MRSRLWMFALASACFAQTTRFYPFSIDQDRLAGAPDFSFLNQPLEAGDRLFVRDGRFYKVGLDLEPFTADDERVRLFGVNLAFGANFPQESDAPRIAKRLRRLGVNLVRFHHMDSQPDSVPANANSILTTGPYPTFNDVSVARLRAFFEALKAEGIYANINLHVGYTFRPVQDGVPALPGNTAFPSQSKPLHILHPRMIELQAEFTRGLFSRLGLAGDPVLGMAELNNETSLIYAWQNGSLDSTALGEYAAVLATRWNEFLRARYQSSEDLRQAWGQGDADGPELLPAQWRPLEIHAGASATLETLADGVVRVTIPTAAPSGGPIVILKKVGFSVATTESYIAEVEMRADLSPGASRPVYWDVKQDVSPWRTVTSKTVQVTSEWQRFRLSFTPGFAIEGQGRFGLSLERMDAPLYVRGATLHTGGRRGWTEEETLDAANFAPVASDSQSTAGRLNDYLDFLADADRFYVDTLAAAARDSNAAGFPLAGTQMGFGGMMIHDSHSGLDFIDQHFYIDHYNFPNVSWDGRDWRIRDSSSIGALWSTFLNVAASRVLGRPYTVSEFNQPWPNTMGAEIDPTLAAFGSFQDWDALVHFAYEHSRAWDVGVPHGFNLNGDWTKFVSAGQSAYLFRTAALAPALESISLPMGREVRLRHTREKRNNNFTQSLGAQFAYEDFTALRHAVALDADNQGALDPSATEKPGSEVTSDTGELTFDRGRLRVLLHSPRVAFVFGQLKRDSVDAGPLTVQLEGDSRDFAAVLLTPLGWEPIEQSKRMLLTLPGYALRTQPGSSPERPQSLVLYAGQAGWYTLEPDLAGKPSGNLNGGSAPVWMERVEASITLRIPAAALSVYALDGNGARLSEVPVEKIEGAFRFRLNAPSPWYELVVPD